MATPSLAMIPSAYADSKVYSVLPNNGDGDFTFNRDSSATRVGQNGLIQTVGFFGNELITNGDFATDSDWTKGTSWTIGGGVATSDGGQSSLTQSIAVVVGRNYLISFNVNRNSGTLFVRNSSDVTIRTIDANNNDSFQSFTYTATSTGLIKFYSYDYNGTIDNVSVQEVTGDQPRLNYDISHGVVQSCPSLLLEPASTNIIPYSEDLTQATIWTATRCNITANQITSPDGTLNADLLTVTDGSIENYVQTSILTVSGTKQTASFFVKKGTSDFSHILLWDASNDGARQWFDLNNGIVGTSTAFGSGISVDSAQIINYGNDWYRCIAVFNNSNTTVRFRMSASNSNGGTTSTIGKTIYLWGAQLEALSYATSYIPTNGASQTRAAETCGDAGNAALFNDSEGVLMAEISSLTNVDSAVRNISLSNGSSLNRISLRYNTTLNTILFQYTVGGSVQVSISYNNVDITGFNKIAVKYKVNDFALWVNGIEVGVDNSGIIMPSNTLDVLNLNGSGVLDPFYGNTKQVQYFNSALTDAQLQTLTTL